MSDHNYEHLASPGIKRKNFTAQLKRGRISLTADATLILVSKSGEGLGSFHPFCPTFGKCGESSRRSAMRRLVEFLRSCSRSIPAGGEMLFAVAHAVPCERHSLAKQHGARLLSEYFRGLIYLDATLSSEGTDAPNRLEVSGSCSPRRRQFHSRYRSNDGRREEHGCELLAEIGTACQQYQNRVLRGLTCKRVQCDEVWSFCYAKQKNVPVEKQGQFDYGDVWTWTATCADTKLICSGKIGTRGASTAGRIDSGA
jgi:hypothetical protein